MPIGQFVRAEEIIRTRIFVRQRNIAGLACLAAHRDANEVSDHVVQPRRFRIHCQIASRVSGVDPCVQRTHIAHAFVFLCIKGHGFGRVKGACFDRRFRDLWHRRVERLGYPLGQCAEFHLSEEFEQFIGNRVTHFKVIEREIQRHVSV